MSNINGAQGPKIDLTGRRYGKLTVVSLNGFSMTNRNKRQYRWNCICDCGNEITVSGHNLQRGHAKSCGCLHKQQMQRFKTINYIHGKGARNSTASYKTWIYIKSRCYNKNNHHTFQYYGAKGIQMWEPWVNDPESFCTYVESMENYGKPGMTIDRIDPLGNYEPGNLRWITLSEQQKNKTNNNLIEWNGEKMTISEWGEKTGIDRRTIQARLRLGWSVDRALSVIPVVGGHYASDNP